MRSGETITLSDITLNTTIHDLKSQYSAKSGAQLDKIKLLLNKKPAADLKTLKELGVEGDVEFSVMLMGGGTGGTPSATTPATEKVEPLMAAPVPAAAAEDKMDVDPPAPAPESEKAQAEAGEPKTQGEDVQSILKTEEFWADVKGFLAQRLRDDKEGERLAGVFREACSKS